jgi:hypothetical protein
VPSQTITSEPKNPTARWKTIGFRVLRFVIAIFLLLAAGGKLAGVYPDSKEIRKLRLDADSEMDSCFEHDPRRLS